MIAAPSADGRQHTLRNLRAFLALAITAIFGGSACHSPSSTVKMPIKLYYVPIGVQTLVPVMPTEIGLKGRSCSINSARDVVKIERILARSLNSDPGAFADKSTRVKLLDGNGSLIAYVDNYGGILFANGRVAKTKNDDLHGLKQLIESRCEF